jgi:hypothetical protein
MFIKLFYIHSDLIERPTITVELCHDNSGNIFLKLKDTWYWLTIDKHDNLDFVEIDYDALTPIASTQQLMKKKIKHVYTTDSLKAKAKQNLIDELEEHDSDDGGDEEYKMYKDNLKYYPEEKHYYFAPEEEEIDEPDEQIFYISSLTDEPCLRKLDRQFDAMSLYDTFVIDTAKGNSNIIFTLESNEKSAYRITIHSTNLFILNIVGSAIKHYSLCFNDTSRPVFKKE